MKKKIIIWIVLLIIVVGGIFYFVRPKKTENKYVTVKALIKNIRQTVSITGNIVPVNQANLSFEVSGEIKDIPIKVGTKVIKGQKIATLDDSIMQSQLQEAKLNLKIQEENLKFKRRKWDNYKPEQKASFKLAVDRARANVGAIQNQINKYELFSPADGIIIKKYINKNEIAKATIPIVTVMKRGGIEIKADVSEADIAKIKLGQKAKVTFDALLSDDIFTAEVVDIDPASTVIQDVVYYKVTLNILNNEKNVLLYKKLRVGMSADIDILTAEKSNVLAIPMQAVKIENGNEYVKVLTKNNNKEKIKKVNVKTGLRGDDGLTEVVSGIQANDEVITFVKEK